MSDLEAAEERAWELMRVEGHSIGSVMRYFGRFTPEERQGISANLIRREVMMAQSAPVTPVRGWRTGDDYTRPQPR